jgi:lipid A 3-O-deacylase
MRLKHFFGLILFSISTISAIAFEKIPVERAARDTHTFSLYIENDKFTGTDQHYTNGTKLNWTSPDLADYKNDERLPRWSWPYIERLPFINKPGLQRNVSLSFGQNIYTPVDIAETKLITDDRPYAGYLYFGFAFQSKTERRLDTIEIDMGIIGPESLGGQTQRLVHQLINVQLPNGWENQLSTELGLSLIYERKIKQWKYEADRGFGFDVIPHFGAALGNVYTFLNAGAEIRLGWNLPSDFGSSTIRPAGDAHAPYNQNDPRFFKRKTPGFYFFAGTDGRWVIRNIFLDGNTFTDSHSVEKEDFVADFSIGASLLVKQLKITYAYVQRTKEFKQQNAKQAFGSLTFSFTY